MTDHVYCYPPDFIVLKNSLGVRNRDELEVLERKLVGQRMRQSLPRGNFDLAHLRAIHRHLFQDIYGWAGELRRVEISKQGTHFQFMRFIETGMADVHRRLSAKRFLIDLTPVAFANTAGEIIGDVNHVHPFREGNGRTQSIYLQQLAENAGHAIDLSRLERDRWIEASRRANDGDYRLMSEAIGDTLV